MSNVRSDIRFPKTFRPAVRRALEGYRQVLEKEGRSPIQIMIFGMVRAYDEYLRAEQEEPENASKMMRNAFELAEKVAPYLYPRQAALEVNQEVTETKRFVISTGPEMTRERWLEVFADRGEEQKLIEGETDD